MKSNGNLCLCADVVFHPLKQLRPPEFMPAFARDIPPPDNTLLAGFFDIPGTGTACSPTFAC